MDEIALSQIISYSSKTDEIWGFCYNHKPDSMKFENHISISTIEDLFKSNTIHVANDALFVSVCPISSADTTPTVNLSFLAENVTVP